MLGERQEGYVRAPQYQERALGAMLDDTSILVLERAYRAMLEDISTLVLGESLDGYVRGYQNPNVMSEARGIC